MPRALLICIGCLLVLPLAAEPVPVQVARVSEQPVTELLQLSGTFSARRSALLSPELSGVVARLPVEEGDQVAAGELLLELDPALAELDSRRSAAALAEAQAQLLESERLLAEVHRLAADNMIPLTQIDAAQAEVQLRKAVVARLQAETDRQAELVRRHRLVAPFGGAISQRLAEQGEWLAAGTPVLELVAIDELRLDLQVPQDYFSDIGAGTMVSIRVDALGGRELPGRVQARIPVADASSRTFLVRIVAESEAGLLNPGMSAQAMFSIPRAAVALGIPRDAVLRGPDGDTRVWIIEERDGELRAGARRVQLGRPLGESVEVRSGLTAGMQVVIRGNELLREGQAVRLQSASGER